MALYKSSSIGRYNHSPTGLNNRRSITKVHYTRIGPYPPMLLTKMQRWCGLAELRRPALWRDVGCELLGTAVLMSVQAAVPLTWNSTQGHVVQVALAMGFVVTALIETLGPLSGAHMNPAVTLSMLLASKVTLTRALLYCVGQCAGALLGAGLVCGITPPHLREGLSATTLHSDVTVWAGFVTEAWLTFMLVLVIHGSTNARRKASPMAAIPIGLTVALDILTGAKYTGSSMNPARSLGPAVVMGIWSHHWIYWAGPIAGGFVATLCYEFVINRVDLPVPDVTQSEDDGSTRTQQGEDQQLIHRKVSVNDRTQHSHIERLLQTESCYNL